MMKSKRKIVLSLVLLALLTPVVILVWNGMSDQIGNADIALVLGNKVNPDGSPSPRLKARLDTAAKYYKNGNYPKVIVSGGTGIEGIPEGTAMKKYLVSLGIPPEAILVDNEGVDTGASAENTLKILKSKQMKSVFVVTQYFHIPRSKLALKKLGVTELYNAHPRFFELRDIYSTAREVPAYLKYLLPSASVRD